MTEPFLEQLFRGFMTLAFEHRDVLFAANSQSVFLTPTPEGSSLFVGYLNRKFIQREAFSSLSKLALCAEKVLAVTIAVLGNYPLIVPAVMAAGDDVPLRGLYTFGVLASMVQDAWCMDKLLVDKFTSKTLEERGITQKAQGCLRKNFQRMAIFSLASASVIPDAYAGYYYNHKSLGWLTASFITNLGYPLVSLGRVVDKLSDGGDFLCRRKQSTNAIQERVLREKKQFIQAIEDTLITLTEMSPSERQVKLSSLYERPSSFLEEGRAILLLHQILDLSQQVEQRREVDPRLLRFAKQFAALVGGGVSCLHYTLSGVMVHEFSDKFLTKNPFLQALVISTSLLPKSYLTVATTQRIFSEICGKVWGKCSSRTKIFHRSVASIAYPKVTKVFQAVCVGAAAVSMAPVYQMVVDRFDMEEIFGEMVMTAVMITGTCLGSMMMVDFAEQIMGEVVKKCGSDDEKDLIDWMERFEQFKQVLSSARNEELAKLSSLMESSAMPEVSLKAELQA